MFNFTEIANYAKTAGYNETFWRELVRSGEPIYGVIVSALASSSHLLPWQAK